MKKRAFATLLAVLLIFQLSNWSGVLRTASADGEETNTKTGFSVTKIELNETDNGPIIAEIENAVTNYNQNYKFELEKKFYVKYFWELSQSHDYWDGDKATIKLPDQLELVTDISGDLKVSDNLSVGTFQTDKNNKTVTLTFNNFVRDVTDPADPDYQNSEGSNISGYIYFWSYLDKDELVDNSNKTIINFDPVKLEIIVKPKNAGPIIHKSNSVELISGERLISWSIDVNQTLDHISDATLIDMIPDNLEVVGPIDIYPVTIDLTGTNLPVVDPTPALIINNVEEVVSGSTMTINLSDELNQDPLTKAYRIQFKTKVNIPLEDTDLVFNNIATIKGLDHNGSKIEKSDNSTVTFKGTPLFQKNHSQPSNDHEYRVDWEIKYNYGQNKINTPKIVDTFSEKHELIDDSFQIYKITFDDEGNEESRTISTDWDNKELNDNGFELSISSATSDAYLIKYSTKTKDPVYDSYTVTNTVGNGSGKSTEDKVSISQKFFDKNYDKNSINYSDKTITWVVDINRIGYNLPELVYEDTFPNNPKGLKLLSLDVFKNSSQTALVEGTDYEITYKPSAIDKTEGFTIKFNNSGSSTNSYQIKYITKFDYEESSKATTLSSYTNKGKLIWNGMPSNVSFEKEWTFTPKPAGWEWINNGKKEGDYNPSKKEITWNIAFNLNKKKMINATVTDELTDIQKYIEGSLEIFELNVKDDGTWEKIGASSLSVLNNYVEPNGSLGQVLTWDFKDSAVDKKAYLITFKTSVEDQQFTTSNGKIVNEAVITYSDDQSSPYTNTVTKEVTIPKAGIYTSKSGSRDGTDPYQINWTVNINEAQSVIKSVKLTDQLMSVKNDPNNKNYSQIYLKNSFELYEAEYVWDNTNNKYNFVSKGAPISENQYELTFNDDSTSFTLDFGEDKIIENAYILKYSSYVEADENIDLSISNKASLSAEGIDHDSTGSQGAVSFKLSGGAGGASLNTGSLIIQKNDTSGASVPGITFNLLRISNGTVYKTGITDSQGKITLTDIRFGNYILQEVEHKYYKFDPNSDNGKYPVTIDTNDPQQIKTITVENEKKTQGPLTIIKKEFGTTNILPGAEFVIYEKNDSAVRSVETTDAEGKITFTNLYHDVEYLLEETKAPHGYNIIGNNPILITISSGNIVFDNTNNALEMDNGALVIKNTKKDIGIIKIKKVGAMGEPLKGAIFSLVNKEYPNEVISNQTTEEDGYATFPALPYGEYELREETAPFGHKIKLDEFNNAQVLEIDLNQSEVEKTIRNDPAFGELEVKKIARNSNPERPLAGAEFILYPKHNKDNQDYTFKGVSGADGIVEFKDAQGISVSQLPVGEYTLKETKAPAGYILNNTEFTVLIEEGKKTVLDPIENQVWYPGPVITPTPTPEPSPEPTDPVEPTDPGETDNPTPTPSPGEPGPTPTPGPSGTPGTENPIDEDDDNNGPANPGKGGEDDTDIDDEEVPLGGGTGTPGVDKLPKTGQDSYLAVQLAGAALVLIGIILVARRRLAMKK